MAPGPHSNPPAGRLSATGRTLAADRPQATGVQLSGGDPVSRPHGRNSPRRLAGASVSADFGAPEEHAAPDGLWPETSTRVERPVVASTHMLACAGRRRAGRSLIFYAGRPGTVTSGPGQILRQQLACGRAVFPAQPFQSGRGGGLAKSPVSIAASEAVVSYRIKNQLVIQFVAATSHENQAPAALNRSQP